MKITRAMARNSCGYCRRGLKAGAENLGLDWDKFCKEGIEASELKATGDARLIKLVEAVENGRQ
jgi:hypothetical protein